jgi:hypothetical protein
MELFISSLASEHKVIIGTALLGGFILYWIRSISFLVFFHPLSEFPGPKLAAASSWWLVYQEWLRGRSLTDILFDLHQRYGMENSPTYHLMLSVLTVN